MQDWASWLDRVGDLARRHEYSTTSLFRQCRSAHRPGIGRLAGGVSTIDAVAPNGPRDDFHNQPTRHADYGMSGHPPPGQAPPTVPPRASPDRNAQTAKRVGVDQAGSVEPGFEQPATDEPFDQDFEPTPWYRKPVLLIAWLVFVLILIALIIYGIMELLNGGQGTTPAPKTSTTSTTTTTTPTTTSTTTTTTPPSSSAGESPPVQQQPTQQPTRQPSQQEPTHRHHLPQLPSVITIPQVPTVITVPPGLR